MPPQQALDMFDDTAPNAPCVAVHPQWGIFVGIFDRINADNSVERGALWSMAGTAGAESAHLFASRKDALWSMMQGYAIPDMLPDITYVPVPNAHWRTLVKHKLPVGDMPFNAQSAIESPFPH